MSARKLSVELLPGAARLLEMHARELPQRDDLCGAFCGALALGAAGVQGDGTDPLDQDAVALAAGSFVSRQPAPEILPAGEQGRRDYRLALPLLEDGESGTTAAGLQRALQRLSRGALAAIPYRGPWGAPQLDGIFDALATLKEPATLIANLATGHLWGSHPSAAQLLAHLLDGSLEGPPPDWRVGHFVCVVGCARGPRGRLYAVADTYPSLGARGVHVQPGELLARALERREQPEGGMFAVVSAHDAAAVRERAGALGLAEGIWDNGTLSHELAA